MSQGCSRKMKGSMMISRLQQAGVDSGTENQLVKSDLLIAYFLFGAAEIMKKVRRMNRNCNYL